MKDSVLDPNSVWVELRIQGHYVSAYTILDLVRALLRDAQNGHGIDIKETNGGVEFRVLHRDYGEDGWKKL